MPTFTVEYSEEDLKGLILKDLKSRIPNLELINEKDISIRMTKTIPDFKAEWKPVD